jgi:hypothetical protein
MKYLFLFGFLGLVIIGFLFYPQVNEDTDSSCVALEKQIIRVNAEHEVSSVVTSLLLDRISRTKKGRGISQGRIAWILMESKYPNLQPIIGCSIFYYEVMFDSKVLFDLIL